MNVDGISEIVKEIVSDVLQVQIGRITLELSIGDVPQWGSMAQMAIIIALQNKFGVKIPMEDLFDLTSVGDLVMEIEKLKYA